MRFKLLAAAAAALFAASAAQAQMVEAKKPQTIVAALQEAGYTAKLATDPTGDPMISSASSGVPFTVFFYNCNDNKNCATIQFSAGFKLTTATTLGHINSWNGGQRFGRAHIDDEGDPVLRMDLDLDDGGMSSALFTDNLEYWVAVLNNFKKHIGFSE
jgi:hypothetical protein